MPGETVRIQHSGTQQRKGMQRAEGSTGLNGLTPFPCRSSMRDVACD